MGHDVLVLAGAEAKRSWRAAIERLPPAPARRKPNVTQRWSA
jgi:hypothetical protein